DTIQRGGLDPARSDFAVGGASVPVAVGRSADGGATVDGPVDPHRVARNLVHAGRDAGAVQPRLCGVPASGSASLGRDAFKWRHDLPTVMAGQGDADGTLNAPG